MNPNGSHSSSYTLFAQSTGIGFIGIKPLKTRHGVTNYHFAIPLMY